MDTCIIYFHFATCDSLVFIMCSTIFSSFTFSRCRNGFSSRITMAKLIRTFKVKICFLDYVAYVENVGNKYDLHFFLWVWDHKKLKAWLSAWLMFPKNLIHTLLFSYSSVVSHSTALHNHITSVLFLFVSLGLIDWLICLFKIYNN